MKMATGRWLRLDSLGAAPLALAAIAVLAWANNAPNQPVRPGCPMSP